uniref:Homeobox protein araucan n=1 Tax=Timema bartmani TaxID=61472 RepID=A0A7R9EPU1_9NEOP|nr:unnamed protein product [Timema bartmani]
MFIKSARLFSRNEVNLLLAPPRLRVSALVNSTHVNKLIKPTTTTSPPLGAGPGSVGSGGGGVPTGALSPGGGSAPSATSCCENGRPIMTDPVSGQTVCSCQYDSARLALSSYPRLSTSGVGVYGTPYPSTDQNPYPSIGVDSSAFYSPLFGRGTSTPQASSEPLVKQARLKHPLNHW